MRLSRWLSLIALVMGVGCLQVAQRNAVFLGAYALGERASRLHGQTTDVAWLHARVIALASPMHLAQVAQERRLKLVAWSTLAPAAAVGSDAALGRAEERALRADNHMVGPLVHMAAVDPGRADTDDEVSD